MQLLATLPGRRELLEKTRLFHKVYQCIISMFLCVSPAAPAQVLGEVGALPDVFSELEVNFFLLRRLLGVRSKEGEKQSKVG